MFKKNLKTFIGAITLVALISFSVVSCKCDKKAVVENGAEGAVAGATTGAVAGAALGSYDSLTGNWIADVGTAKEFALPGGYKFSAGENSAESKLLAKLTDANFKVSDSVSSGDWITLDRVYFETGKDVMTAESAAQVKNIAEIMKAYPTAQLKLGGYTDNTGSDAVNVPISDKRAKKVMTTMVELGGNAANMSAEGFGSKFPVCAANDTDVCKAQNRRVDVRLKSK